MALAHVAAPHRIETAHGFVEDQEPRLVQDGLREAPCAGSCPWNRCAGGGKASRPRPCTGRREASMRDDNFRPERPAEAPVVLEKLHPGEVVVEPGLLGLEADAPARGRIARVEPHETD